MKLEIPKIFNPLFKEKKRYKLLHGGRAGGKSNAVARYLLIKGLEKKTRILCTREVQRSISESVHKLLADLIFEYRLPYRVMKNAIFCDDNGTEFIFHGLRDDTSKSIKSMEGIDICWVEEAQFVSKPSIEILIPTIIRNEGAEIVFTYNRLEESDPVHEKFALNPSDNTLVVEVNYYNNPFITDAIKEEALQCKEENMSDYLHIWEGQPLVEGDNVALPAYRVRSAMDRKVNAEGVIEIGVDVARGGGDRTSVYKRHGLKVVDYWSTKEKMRFDDLGDKIIDIAGSKFDLIRVDDTGLGCGLTDELERRLGRSRVQGVNFASKEGIDKNKYPDLISSMYFEFEKILDEVQLPNDPDLLKELSTRRYHYKNTKKVRQIESKDDFKKRYKRSPDLADALLLCFIGKKIETLDYAFV